MTLIDLCSNDVFNDDTLVALWGFHTNDKNVYEIYIGSLGCCKYKLMKSTIIEIFNADRVETSDVIPINVLLDYVNQDEFSEYSLDTECTESCTS